MRVDQKTARETTPGGVWLRRHYPKTVTLCSVGERWERHVRAVGRERSHSMDTRFQSVAPGLWLGGYSLKMLGVDLGRNCTVVRLDSGRVVIHSTAPFSDADVAEIHRIGEPGWMVEAMLRHDTFAAEGRAAFPAIPYLAPDGFSAELPFPTGALLPPPPEWGEELVVVKIDGAPTFEEHVMFHAASRTLIVADLLFHFAQEEPLWTEILLRAASVGGHHAPGMSRLFKAAITDEAAFGSSMAKVFSLDFNRIVVGHGERIETNGRALLEDAFREAGLPLS